jgi:plastocyanin
VKPPTPPWVARAGLVALALLVAACGGSSASGGTPAGAHVIHVTERDFHIAAPERVSTGNLVLKLRNNGPDTHELLLVRSNGRKLPLRADDLTVDEDAVKPRTIGQLEDVQPGSSRTWTLHLAPGRYELFCNMSGHYLAGMHTELVVK